MHKILNPIKENIKEQLQPFTTKKDLTAQELDNIKDALCILSMIEDALDRDAEYSRMEDIYGRGVSYRRGRDSQTGQYVSRGRMYPDMGYAYAIDRNYSMNSPKHQALTSLEQAMRDAKSDQERMMYQGMINDLQMNQ